MEGGKFRDREASNGKTGLGDGGDRLGTGATQRDDRGHG